MKTINDAIQIKLAQINQLQEEIKALEAAAKILDAGFESPESVDVDLTVRPRRTSLMANRWPIPIGDAAQRVLKDAGTPLNIREIAKRLESLGVTPGLSTLTSGLIKDYRKRFKKLGGGMYALVDTLSPIDHSDDDEVPPEPPGLFDSYSDDIENEPEDE